MPNIFDQFDEEQPSSNPFDQFDQQGPEEQQPQSNSEPSAIVYADGRPTKELDISNSLFDKASIRDALRRINQYNPVADENLQETADEIASFGRAVTKNPSLVFKGTWDQGMSAIDRSNIGLELAALEDDGTITEEQRSKLIERFNTLEAESQKLTPQYPEGVDEQTKQDIEAARSGLVSASQNTQGTVQGIAVGAASMLADKTSIGKFIPKWVKKYATTAAGLEPMAMQVYGLSYMDARNQNLDHKKADMYGRAMSTINVATEAIPVGRLSDIVGIDLNSVPGGKGAIARFMREEMLGEMLATTGEEVTNWAFDMEGILKDSKSPEEALSKMMDAYRATFIATVTGGTAQAGAAHTGGLLIDAATGRANRPPAPPTPEEQALSAGSNAAAAPAPAELDSLVSSTPERTQYEGGVDFQGTTGVSPDQAVSGLLKPVKTPSQAADEARQNVAAQGGDALDQAVAAATASGEPNQADLLRRAQQATGAIPEEQQAPQASPGQQVQQPGSVQYDGGVDFEPSMPEPQPKKGLELAPMEQTATAGNDGIDFNTGKPSRMGELAGRVESQIQDEEALRLPAPKTQIAVDQEGGAQQVYAPSKPAGQGGPGMDQQTPLGEQKDYVPQPDGGRTLRQVIAEREQAKQMAELGLQKQEGKAVLQNRDRSSKEMIKQMNSIAAKPDYHRVGPSRDFASGAPVVEPGANIRPEQLGRKDVSVTGNGRKIPTQYAVVSADDLLPSNDVNGSPNKEYMTGMPGKSRAVSGNGRVAGLQSAHKRGTMDQYIKDLKADAALHGISSKVIDGIKNPILVRIMPAEEVTANIGDESNTTGTAALTASEQAKTDANRVDINELDFAPDGGIGIDTVMAFIRAMPQSEQSQLMDGGRPSKQAMDRIENAIFATAYESDELIRLQAQATDTEARNIMAALLEAAPLMAQLKGLKNGYDIRYLVAEAAELAISARRRGQSLEKAAEQVDLDANPLAQPLLESFAENIKSQRAIADHLMNLADDLIQASNLPEDGLFGGVEKPTLRELLEKRYGKRERKQVQGGAEKDSGDTGRAGLSEGGSGRQEAQQGSTGSQQQAQVPEEAGLTGKSDAVLRNEGGEAYIGKQEASNKAEGAKDETDQAGSEQPAGREAKSSGEAGRKSSAGIESQVPGGQGVGGLGSPVGIRQESESLNTDGLDRRAGQRTPPTTGKEVWKEALASIWRIEFDIDAINSLPVEARRAIEEQYINKKIALSPIPLDKSGVADGEAVVDPSRVEESTIKGLYLEGVINALSQHAKNGGHATLSEIDLGNLGGINHYSGQKGGDKALADIARIISDELILAGVDAEVIRYGGDEFFVGARDADVSSELKIIDKKVQEYMRSTTPSMLNPSLKANIEASENTSDAEKEIALRFLDTPLSELPKKYEVKDGEHIFPKGNTRLHVGDAIEITAGMNAVDAYNKADAVLSIAKSRNIRGVKEGKQDAPDQDVLFSRVSDEDKLFVGHNLSEENLHHAAELGGIAAPSLAVAKAKNGFSGFGEITLLADPSFLESGKVRTFDADVYSPRHPKAIHSVDEKAFDEIKKVVEESSGVKIDVSPYDMEDGPYRLAQDLAFKMAWLKSNGINIKVKTLKEPAAVKRIADMGLSRFMLEENEQAIKLAEGLVRKELNSLPGDEIERFRDVYLNEDGTVKRRLVHDVFSRAERYKEDGGIDRYATDAEVNKALRKKGLRQEYERHASKEFRRIVKDRRIFKGFTNSGNRKYVPYNLENIVRDMTAELRGGEGFNYGAGNIRAAYASEFKSVAAVKKARDKIVTSEQMEKIKEESQQKVLDAVDALRPFYKFDTNSFGYINDATSAIGEGPSGWREAFNLDADSRKIITDLVDYLKELPTEYFEAKAQRAVGIGEFKAAVVPDTVTQETIDLLMESGITNIRKYKAGNEQDRAKKIGLAKDVLFSRNWYRSELSETVAGMDKIANKDGMVGAGQAKMWLAARQKEGKFKQDEIDAIGLNDWLDMNTGKVAVTDIQAFVADNGVNVKETTLGGLPKDAERKLGEMGYSVEDGVNDEQYIADEDGEPVDFEDLPDEAKELFGSVGDAAKYAQYQITGGENYRELLLTLPPKTNTKAGSTVRFANEDAVESFLVDMSAAGFEDLDYGRLDSDELAVEFDGPIPAGVMPLIEENRGSIIKGQDIAGKTFVSSHFNQPNILAHVRFNERTDADGKKVLFIEEIQSDWAQRGRKEGFRGDKSHLAIYDRDGYLVATGTKSELDKIIAKEDPDGRKGLKIEPQGSRDVQGVPSAPFVTKTEAWVSLAMKRMIAYAADNGFDRIAWTTGEQQADRYDLSKQVNKIRYYDNEDGTYDIEVYVDGDSAQRAVDTQFTNKKPEELEDIVGKEIVKKIVASEGLPETDSSWKNLSGGDLKVGGEGMKAFYDNIVPNVASKIIKKMGGNLADIDIGVVDKKVKPHVGRVYGENDKPWFVRYPTPNNVSFFDTREEAEAYAEELRKEIPADKAIVQKGFDITPKMREQVSKGLPLFKQSQQATKRQTMPVESAQRMMDAIGSKLKGSPKIVVVQSLQDPKVPERVRTVDAEQRSQGASGSVEGFFFDGKAYIVMNGVNPKKGESMQAAVFRVFAHEVLGHAGLRGAFGDSLNNVLDEVITKRGEMVRRKAKQYGLNANDQKDARTAAEEVLAEMAQEMPDHSLVKKAVEAIRRALRAIYMKLPADTKKALGGRQFIDWINGMSDAEMVERFILPARRFIENGRGPDGGGKKPAFNRSNTGNISGMPQFDNASGDFNPELDKFWIGKARQEIDGSGMSDAEYNTAVAEYANLRRVEGVLESIGFMASGASNISSSSYYRKNVGVGEYDHEYGGYDEYETYEVRVSDHEDFHPAMDIEVKHRFNINFRSESESWADADVGPDLSTAEISSIILDLLPESAKTDVPAGNDGFSLQGQTPEEVRQQEADRKAAEKAAKNAKAKLDADASRDSFTLTGSNSDSDQAMAAGQQSLFSRREGTLLPAERGLYYEHGQEILESRLEQWAATVNLNSRGGIGIVQEELRQAAESGRDNGGGALAQLGGSSQETIQRESDELITRAKENGFFLTTDDILVMVEGAEPIKGGIEHNVLLVGGVGKRLVVRNTKDGRYGFLPGASPVQYLRRLARNNEAFPATPIQVIGVSEGANGEAVIWTAQSFVAGEIYDSEREFSEAMNKHGWERHGIPNRYIHKETGAIIRDASKANVLYVGGELFPVDVIVEKTPEQIKSATGNNGEFDSGNPDIRFSRSGWQKDFPDAVIGHRSVQDHPDYAAAKAGDMDAALRLADDVVTDEYAESVRSAIGDESPAIVPVLAVEQAGNNRIPLAVAAALGKKLGIDVDAGIVQAEKVSRGGSSGFHRLANQPTFSGAVTPGKSYIVLDDTLAQGGTLAQLKEHIEQGGGRVVLATALTGKQYSAKLAIDGEMLAELRDKYSPIEPWFKSEFGYDFSGLTQSEARYIVKSGASPESVRDRILAERNAGGPAKGSSLFSRQDSSGSVTGSSNSSIERYGLLADVPVETPFRRFQRIWQDSFNRWNVIQQWLAKNGVSIADDSDVYQAETLMHGRIATRIEDFRKERVRPLIKEIRKAGFSLEQVADFLHAQHAEERNRQIARINPDMPDGGSGMSTADARAKLAKYREESPELEALANEFRAITEDTKQVLLTAGIISQEMADAWDATYEHYVPLKGGDEVAKTGTGKGLSVVARARRAMGHNRREERIIENILRDHEMAIQQAEKNRVGQIMLKLALESGHPDLITIDQPVKRKVLRDQKSYVVTYAGSAIEAFDSMNDARQFILQEASKRGRSKADFDIETSHDLSVAYMAKPTLDENETNVYANGHAIRIQFTDDLLARAWKNMGAEHMNAIFRGARAANAWFSKAYTGYNPEFIAINIMRDFQGGTINVAGEYGIGMAAKAWARYPSAFAGLLKYAVTGKKSQVMEDYRAAGGTTGAAYLPDLERVGDDVRAAFEDYAGLLEAAGTANGFRLARVAGRKTVGALAGWIEALNMAGENAFRMALYQAMVDSGHSKSEAAKAAKNATVNFNKRGEAGQMMSAMYLFFNPATQGAAIIGKSLFQAKHKHQAQALVAGMAMIGFALAISNGGGDEDEWEKLNESTKERFIPIWTGSGWVTIPVPYGHGFFYNLGRYMANIAKGAPVNRELLKAAANMADEFTVWGSVTNPEGDSKNVIFLAPTLAQMIVTPAANRTSLGSPVYPESPYDRTKPDFMKKWRSTQGSVWDKAATGLSDATGGNAVEAGWIDVSPETFRYIWNTATGGTGKSIMDTASATGIAVQGSAPELIEIPVVRKLYRQADDVRGARARFWEAVDAVDAKAEAFSRARALAKEGNEEGLALGKTMIQERLEMLRLAHQAEGYRKLVSMRRDASDAIMADDTRPLDERRRKVREIEREEIKLYDEFVAEFKKRGGRLD